MVPKPTGMVSLRRQVTMVHTVTVSSTIDLGKRADFALLDEGIGQQGADLDQQYGSFITGH